MSYGIVFRITGTLWLLKIVEIITAAMFEAVLPSFDIKHTGFVVLQEFFSAIHIKLKCQKKNFYTTPLSLSQSVRNFTESRTISLSRVVKNVCELLNIRALKISTMYKNCIFQCVGKIFCVEFQRYPLKIHTNYLTHTLKDVYFFFFLKDVYLFASKNLRALRFKSS